MECPRSAEWWALHLLPEPTNAAAAMDKLRAAEIAKYLGVTRERVRQITAADPSFPQLVETEPHRRSDRAEVERPSGIGGARGRGGRGARSPFHHESELCWFYVWS